MFKVLRKKTTIALALVAGMSVTNQPLHAEWTATQYAEAATGVLRGIGSKFEHDVKNNTSKRAHLTRLLVSALRVTHGALAITNHSGDYQSYYLHSLIALDGAQGLAYGARWLNEQEEEILLEESIEPVSVERLEFVRKYALPALESFAAVLVACTGNGDVASQKALFTGQALLALARTCQTSLDQEQGWVKNTIGTLVLVNAVYATYQLLHEESGLNAWIADKQKVEDARIRLEAEQREAARVAAELAEQQRIAQEAQQAEAARLEQERIAEQQRQEQEAQAALEREQEAERQRLAQAELEAARQREQEAERLRLEEERRQNVLNALRLREEQAAELERKRLEEEAVLRREQEEAEEAKKLEKEAERKRKREEWAQKEQEAQNRRLAEQQRQEELAAQQRKDEEQRLADLEAAKLQKKQALLDAQQQREAQTAAAQRQQIAEIKEKDDITEEDLKVLRQLHALALQQGDDGANEIFETIKDLTIIKNNKDKQRKIEAKNNRLKRLEAKK